MNDYSQRIEKLENMLENSYMKKEYETATKFVDLIVKYYEEAELIETKEFAQTLYNIGLIYDKLNMNDRALLYYRRSSTLKMKLEVDPISLGKSLNNLGVIYYKLKEWDLGITTHKEVFAIRNKELGLENIHTLNSLYHIGKGYENINQYRNALIYLDKYLDKIKTIEKVSTKELAEIYSDVGNCCQRIGNYKRAIASYETTLYFLEKQNIDNSQLCISIMEKLADVCEKSGFNQLAYEYNEKCIETRFGNRNENTLSGLFYLYNFGRFCYRVGFINRSLKIFNEAFEIANVLLDKSHEAYSNLLHDIALCYMDKKDLQQAISCTQESLNYKLEYFPDNIYSIMDNIITFVKIYTELGDYEKAFDYLYKGFEDVTRRDLNQSDLKIFLLMELSNVYEKLLGFDGAIASLNQCIQIISNKNDDRNEAIINQIYLKLSELYLMQNNYEESIESLRKVQDLYEKSIGKNHDLYAELLKKFANIYMACKDYYSGIEYLEQARKIQIAIIDSDSPKYIETLELLGDMYYKSEKYNDVITVLKERNNLNYEETAEEQNQSATTLMKIALSYLRMGNMDKSKTYNNEAYQKQKKCGLEPEVIFTALVNEFLQVLENPNYKKNDKKIGSGSKNRNRHKINLVHLKKNWLAIDGLPSDNNNNIHKTISAFSVSEICKKLGEQGANINWLKHISEIAKGTNYDMAMVQLGHILLSIGREDEAFEYFILAKNNMEKYNNKHNVAYSHVLYFLGEWYIVQKNLELANTFFAQWHKLYKELDLPMYQNYETKIEKIAKMNVSIRNYPLILKYYTILMDMGEKNFENTLKHLNYTLKVAHSYILMEENMQGENILNKSMKIVEKMESKNFDNHTAHDKIGRLYVLAGEFQTGAEVLKIAYNNSFEHEKALTKDGYNSLLIALKEIKDVETYEIVKKHEKL